MDRLLKPSKAAERLAPRLLTHLNEPLDFNAYMVNLARLQHWVNALNERKRPSSMRWWSEQLKHSVAVSPDVGQRFLSDDLDKLREKWTKAKKWEDLEGDACEDDHRW